jgi:hypothetical protein
LVDRGQVGNEVVIPVTTETNNLVHLVGGTDELVLRFGYFCTTVKPTVKGWNYFRLTFRYSGYLVWFQI